MKRRPLKSRIIRRTSHFELEIEAPKADPYADATREELIQRLEQVRNWLANVQSEVKLQRESTTVTVTGERLLELWQVLEGIQLPYLMPEEDQAQT